MDIVKQIYNTKNELFAELKYNKENFSSFSKHSHKSLNIVAISSSSIDINYHKKCEAKLHPNSIALFNPMQVHLTTKESKEKIDYYSLHLNYNWCLDIQKELFKNTKSFIEVEQNIINKAEITKEFKQICNQILNKNCTNLEPTLKSFISKIFTNYCNTTESKGDNQLLKKVKELILNSIEYPLNIEEIANSTGYSTAHLNRVFKKEYGLTLHAYLIDQKLQIAKDLIQNSNYTLTQIAHQSGFYDQSHFIKVFKKAYSLSPKAYKVK